MHTLPQIQDGTQGVEGEQKFELPTIITYGVVEMVGLRTPGV